jgi:hypothetical protein
VYNQRSWEREGAWHGPGLPEAEGAFVISARVRSDQGVGDDVLKRWRLQSFAIMVIKRGSPVLESGEGLIDTRL